MFSRAWEILLVMVDVGAGDRYWLESVSVELFPFFLGWFKLLVMGRLWVVMGSRTMSSIRVPSGVSILPLSRMCL